MAKPWIAEFGAGGALVAAQTLIEPVGMVIGNVVLQPGLFGGPPANSTEYSDASKRAMRGWETVLERLREKADELGADGVLSIKLSRRDWDERGVTEFCGIGTAVRGLRRQDGIWTAGLGPEEIALLNGQGYKPVCLTIGCCTWHQSSYRWNPVRKNVFNPYGSQEIVPATQALYTARAIAQERMQQEAAKRGASGIVGAQIKMTRVYSEGMLVGFLAGCEAQGTGIARSYGDFRSGEMICAVPLND